MNDTRYLYEVRPVRPINISGKSVRVPCSIQLTKAEVLEYMKSAAIYRRFAASEPVKVTGENIDALHQQTYNPNFKSVVTVPTFAVPKVDTVVTPPVDPEPEQPAEDPVVDPKQDDEEDTGKKSNEEESSVISSETSEDQETSETTPEPEAEETPATDDEKENQGEKDSSSDEAAETTVAPEETVDKKEQPAQAPVTPSINLKGNNGNNNKNNHNNNGKNYKK